MPAKIKFRLTLHFLLVATGEHIHHHKVGARYLQQVQNLEEKTQLVIFNSG